LRNTAVTNITLIHVYHIVRSEHCLGFVSKRYLVGIRMSWANIMQTCNALNRTRDLYFICRY